MRLVQIIGIAVVSFLAFASSLVNASHVEVVQVSPLTEQMLIFNLRDGLQFTGSLSINGGSGNDIDFWITDPQGTKILDLGRVSQGETFKFIIQVSGAYTFHFGNTFSWFNSKTVNLTYSVGLLKFGGGRDRAIDLLTLVAVIIILTIAMIILVIVISRGKRSSKTNQTPPPIDRSIGKILANLYVRHRTP